MRSGHPRACGENPSSATTPWPVLRAIPARAGRTPFIDQRDRNDDRAIPARAGRTVSAYIPYDPNVGPSPRVRGEHVCAQGAAQPYPGHPRACGENASRSARWLSPRAGHPRACGENSTGTHGNHRRRPGHPRACGENAPGSGGGEHPQRAIPARAGRTPKLPYAPPPSFGPSPRVRGELFTPGKIPCVITGPSPRVRGERPAATSRCRASPGHPRACGENAGAGCSVCSPLPGHPRACGENTPGG